MFFLSPQITRLKKLASAFNVQTTPSCICFCVSVCWCCCLIQLSKIQTLRFLSWWAVSHTAMNVWLNLFTLYLLLSPSILNCSELQSQTVEVGVDKICKRNKMVSFFFPCLHYHGSSLPPLPLFWQGQVECTSEGNYRVTLNFNLRFLIFGIFAFFFRDPPK